MGMEEKIKAGTLNAADWLQILRCSEWDDILRQTADQLRQEVYGKDVYLRGLIEYTARIIVIIAAFAAEIQRRFAIG